MTNVNTNTNSAGATANDMDLTSGNENITLPATEEELNALLQREGDKRVPSALKKREEKLKSEFESKIEEAKAEASKLAKMTQAEREKAEFEKERAIFESQRKEFARTQLLNQTMLELQKENLPVSFSEYMMDENAEKVASKINDFKKLWQEELQKSIDERIKSKTPKAGAVANTAITKESFNKMTYKERMALYNNDRGLYESLNK